MLGPFLRPSREASSLAASMLVLVQALTGAAFLIALTSEKADVNFLWAIGVLFVLAALLFWLSFKPVTLLKDTMSWVRSRRARPENLDFSLTRREAAIARFGTNARLLSRNCGSSGKRAPTTGFPRAHGRSAGTNSGFPDCRAHQQKRGWKQTPALCTTP